MFNNRSTTPVSPTDPAKKPLFLTPTELGILLKERYLQQEKRIIVSPSSCHDYLEACLQKSNNETIKVELTFFCEIVLKTEPVQLHDEDDILYLLPLSSMPSIFSIPSTLKVYLPGIHIIDNHYYAKINITELSDASIEQLEQLKILADSFLSDGNLFSLTDNRHLDKTIDAEYKVSVHAHK